MVLAVRRFLLHSQTMELAVCVALSGSAFLSSRPDCVLTFREKVPGLTGVVTLRGFLLAVRLCMLSCFRGEIHRSSVLKLTLV